VLYWYEIFKVFIPRICWLYSMWEISFPLVLLVSIHQSILRSCDRKFVFRFWCHSRRCHRYKENFQKPNLCFRGLGNFPQKIFSQTNYLYINKSLQEMCCSCFEALSINESFQLNYQPNRKTVITTELFSFLSVEKIVHHFHLISFTGLNRHTDRPMIIIANLKKSIRIKVSRPLVDRY